jgi:hypothetical protein
MPQRISVRGFSGSIELFAYHGEVPIYRQVTSCPKAHVFWCRKKSLVFRYKLQRFEISQAHPFGACYAKEGT